MKDQSVWLVLKKDCKHGMRYRARRHVISDAGVPQPTMDIVCTSNPAQLRHVFLRNGMKRVDSSFTSKDIWEAWQ